MHDFRLRAVDSPSASLLNYSATETHLLTLLPLRRMDNQSWHRRDGDRSYLVSTSPYLLNHDFIQKAFSSEEMYWAKPLAPGDLALMLSQSVTLGLYQTSQGLPPPASIDEPSSPRTPSPTLADEGKEILEQVGMARFITDRVSTAYLTDVYILPTHRANGLGRWLVACCNEILQQLPALRRAFLVASPGVGKTFYTKELGFWDMHEERDRVVCMTKKTWH